jgi:hypothetical protein
MKASFGGSQLVAIWGLAVIVLMGYSTSGKWPIFLYQKL